VNKKKVIVTGGVGYIGSHTVVKLIEAGYEPIIIDDFSNSSLNMYERLCDLVGYRVPLYKFKIGNCISTLTVDYQKFWDDLTSWGDEVYGVIHFAGYKSVSESVNYPLRYYMNNIDSTLNVLELIKAKNIKRLVFSSSATVYGEADSFPVSEESPKKTPTNPYGKTKSMCEDIIKDFSEDLGLNIRFSPVILRYFNPIGAHPSGKIFESPQGRPENLVPYIQRVLNKKEESYQELVIFGDDYNTEDGTCIRDYVDVNDLADAHIKALEACEDNKVKIYNIGSGNGYSVLDVVDTFEDLGAFVPYKFGNRREGDVPKIYANINKAKEELGWEPTTSLEDSIKSVINLF
jgi:UDP-glucose 4-epimerase